MAMSPQHVASASGSSSSGYDRSSFANAVLTALGIQPNSQNVRALEAWMQAEGTSAAYNPLATTQGWNGASNFNSVGVKNYESFDDGVAATVRTLTNGLYGNILDALRSGSAMDVANAVYHSPWGTGAGVIRVLGGTVSDAPIGTGGGSSGSSSGGSSGPGSEDSGADESTIKGIFQAFVGRDPTPEEVARYTGHNQDEISQQVGSTLESKGFRAADYGLQLFGYMEQGAGAK